MNKVIIDILNNGCELNIKKVGVEINYFLEGFYKYGEVKMIIQDDSNNNSPIDCLTRYGIKHTINSFDDLKDWNLEVWDLYKNDFSSWDSPEYPFGLKL